MNHSAICRLNFFSLNTCVKIQTLEHLGKGRKGVSIVVAIVTVVLIFCRAYYKSLGIDL